MAVDTTPVTPMLLSIGLDARALDGDVLPDGRTQWSANPSSFQERRGSPGDALDGDGRFAGSRLWLLSRSKQSEETRLLTEYYARDSLFWAEDMTGDVAEIEAWWHARNMLGLRCSVAGEAITVSKRIDR
ncbi:phage GP46 family protein [uncultured Martelella sp.]|uniref:phage GP46 family protein n=1 Tax=uncultured Martelella sp. TaxID=392331 RepID=UPI0029C93B23|nr:phage GP46 family protein [uncultured Martelella sp.]